MDSFQAILSTERILWGLIYNRWLTVELFSSRWFIMLGCMIVAYILLVKFIAKSRLIEILLYGSLLAVSFGFIDVTGTTVGFWAYETRFVPLVPSLFPLTYTIHPILHMAVYQYTFSWRSFIIANTLASAFFAYVIHPVFSWLNIIQFGPWTYSLSFIVSMATTTLAKFIMEWLIAIQEQRETQSGNRSLFGSFQPATKPTDDAPSSGDQ